jgi:predicted PurR-regulated permease PerM
VCSSDLYRLAGLKDAPTLTQLVFNEGGQRFFATIANSVRGLSGDIVLILIYVAFLFTAQSMWTQKLDNIFPDSQKREMVRRIGNDARLAIETYLWTQTVISAMITLLTYLSLLALGVQNALFLSAVIFVLNYIPTVGSIVAALVPPLFALVQPVIPGWVPVFGIAKKVIEELVELHRRNQIPNEDIKKDAEKAGLKKAAKMIEKL